jgi:hypothetical protein
MKIVRIKYNAGELMCDVSKIIYIRSFSHRGYVNYSISINGCVDDEFQFENKEQYEKALKTWQENASE